MLKYNWIHWIITFIFSYGLQVGIRVYDVPFEKNKQNVYRVNIY